MANQKSSSRSGQALIMVTVALIAMSGLIGMAVDFGWSYYIKRTQQSAADAAAMAAVNKAWDLMTSGTNLACSTDIACTASSGVDCSSTLAGNLQFACSYAKLNGFTSGGDSGRQDVTVTAGVPSPSPSPPPTAPGANVYYWVTVRITDTVPQLYSALLGNATATVAARATAGIVRANVRASLIGLNRQNDVGPTGTTDSVDLLVGSFTQIQAANGIFLSSLGSGAGTCNRCMGVTGYPSGPVYTLIRSSGTTQGAVTGGGTSWTWQNQGDGAPFSDPMRSLGQPPLGSAINPIAVPGGTITTSGQNAVCPGAVCAPGDYYATDSNGNATGQGISIPSGTSVSFSGAGFSDYVFFGGLNITGANVTFGPGRYVMAGVLAPATSYDLNISGGSTVTGGSGSDAGRLFILTDSSYGGALDSIRAAIPTAVPTLSYGPSRVGATGVSPDLTDANTTVTLYGLDSTKSLPTDTNSFGYTLNDFGPTLFWQDQGFSSVKYTANGNIDTSSACGGTSIDSPCTQTPPTPATTPPLLLNTQKPVNLNGVVYQPRGSWMRLGSNSKLTAMQLISGAFDFKSNANPATVVLPPLPYSLLRRAVALVE